jgi:hypothetical protein
LGLFIGYRATTARIDLSSHTCNSTKLLDVQATFQASTADLTHLPSDASLEMDLRQRYNYAVPTDRPPAEIRLSGELIRRFS